MLLFSKVASVYALNIIAFVVQVPNHNGDDEVTIYCVWFHLQKSACRPRYWVPSYLFGPIQTWADMSCILGYTDFSWSQRVGLPSLGYFIGWEYNKPTSKPQWISVADTGFPAEGHAAAFRNFVCQNERIGSIGGSLLIRPLQGLDSNKMILVFQNRMTFLLPPS